MGPSRRRLLAGRGHARPRWLITLGVAYVIYCPVRSTPGGMRP